VPLSGSHPGVVNIQLPWAPVRSCEAPYLSFNCYRRPASPISTSPSCASRFRNASAPYAPDSVTCYGYSYALPESARCSRKLTADGWIMPFLRGSAPPSGSSFAFLLPFVPTARRRRTPPLCRAAVRQHIGPDQAFSGPRWCIIADGPPRSARPWCEPWYVGLPSSSRRTTPRRPRRRNAYESACVRQKMLVTGLNRRLRSTSSTRLMTSALHPFQGLRSAAVCMRLSAFSEPTDEDQPYRERAAEHEPLGERDHPHPKT